LEVVGSVSRFTNEAEGLIEVLDGGALSLNNGEPDTSDFRNRGHLAVAEGGRLELHGEVDGSDGSIALAGQLRAYEAQIHGGGNGGGIEMAGGEIAGQLASDQDVFGHGRIGGELTLGESRLIADAPARTLQIEAANILLNSGFEDAFQVVRGGWAALVGSRFNGQSETGFLVDNKDFDARGDEDYSELVVRDSELLIDGRVGDGGRLETFGDVALGAVEVTESGRVVVHGNASAGRLHLSNSWMDEAAQLQVRGGARLAAGRLEIQSHHDQGHGVAFVEGELAMQHPGPDAEPGNDVVTDGTLRLNGGTLSADYAITHDGEAGIRGCGRIPAAMVNHGRIHSDVPGGWLVLDTHDKLNHSMGLIVAGWEGGGPKFNGGDVSVKDIRLENQGVILIERGSKLLIDGGIVDNTRGGSTEVHGEMELRHGGAITGDLVVFSSGLDVPETCRASSGMMAADVHFDGHRWSPQSLEVAGADLGLDPAGLSENFAFRSLTVADTELVLVDRHDNQLDGQGQPEALYVQDLLIGEGASFDLSAGAIYYGVKEVHKLFVGDCNLDGSVGLLDLGTLADNWGATSATWSLGDCDGDGLVGLLDLALLADNWNAGGGGAGGLAAPPPTSVPEPTAMALLLAGALLAGRRHRGGRG
jgi:hypothetical protein